MPYEGAQEARKHMKVPCEIIRVPKVSLSFSLALSGNVDKKFGKMHTFTVSWKKFCFNDCRLAILYS